jgi:hypothetical protein
MTKSLPPTEVKSLSSRDHGLIALVSLAIGVGLLVYYVHQVPRLGAGVRDQVYYVVLFPSAVACAVALFGAMRGYARLTARRPGMALEIGGPAALFVLIIWGGFKLPPRQSDTFDLTVRAHSSDGRIPIITSGKIILDLDNDRRMEDLHSNGEADFKGVPIKFQGAAINVLAQVDGYEQRWEAHTITSTFLDLALTLAPATVFRGFVHDELGNALSGVRVRVADCNADTVTNDAGVFGFQIDSKFHARCHLAFTKSGYSSYDTDVAIDQDPDHRFLLRRGSK